MKSPAPLLAALALCLALSPGLSAARAQAQAGGAAAPAAAAGNADNGKQVFNSQGCYKCHGAQGQGMSTAQNPSAGPRIGPPRLALPAFLTFVRNPQGQMIPFSPQDVSDAALTDVYAYLQTLGRVQVASLAPGNAQNGQRYFHDDGCYQCHGDRGQGSFQTGGSRIGPPQIELSAFLAYVRQPTNQMPPYTVTAIPDQQVADIYAYLKSIPAAPSAKNIPLLNQ